MGCGESSGFFILLLSILQFCDISCLLWVFFLVTKLIGFFGNVARMFYVICERWPSMVHGLKDHSINSVLVALIEFLPGQCEFIAIWANKLIRVPNSLKSKIKFSSVELNS